MNSASIKNIIVYREDPMANFFREIGRADELGSGLRKTTKYTPIYSDGAKPTFEEGDVFKMQVPLKNKITDPVNDAVKDQSNKGVGAYDAVNDAVNDAASDAVINRLVQEVLLVLVEKGKGLKGLMAAFNVARATMQRDMALLKAHQFIEFIGSPKTGVYTLTEKFKKQIEEIK